MYVHHYMNAQNCCLKQISMRRCIHCFFNTVFLDITTNFYKTRLKDNLYEPIYLGVIQVSLWYFFMLEKWWLNSTEFQSHHYWRIFSDVLTNNSHSCKIDNKKRLFSKGEKTAWGQLYICQRKENSTMNNQFRCIWFSNPNNA